jgi:hypothetical protein
MSALISISNLRNAFLGPFGGKPSLGERLRAWWDGYSLVMPTRAPEDDDAAGAAADNAASASSAPDSSLSDPRIPTSWTPTRIKAAQLIWGEGYLSPGGEGYFTELVNPLGLVPAVTLLDLNAGIGGGIRAAHHGFGAWTEGYEVVPELASAGMQMSKMAGLSSKAPVRVFDPVGENFPKGPYDCVIAREFFYRIANKQALLGRVERSMKKRGQLLFTDFVLTDPNKASASVDAWHATEPVPSTPWTEADYVALFERLEFELRISDDITEQYRGLIQEGWRNLMPTLEAMHDTPVDIMRAVLDEVGLWTRRSMILKSGDIRLMRFHVLKMGGGGK